MYFRKFLFKKNKKKIMLQKSVRKKWVTFFFLLISNLIKMNESYRFNTGKGDFRINYIGCNYPGQKFILLNDKFNTRT